MKRKGFLILCGLTLGGIVFVLGKRDAEREAERQAPDITPGYLDFRETDSYKALLKKFNQTGSAFSPSPRDLPVLTYDQVVDALPNLMTLPGLRSE
jgi:hypothetical protein